MAQPKQIQVDERLRSRFLHRQIRVIRRGDWECWIWQGACDRAGYGVIVRDRQSYRAHRVSYEIFIGPIPPGLVIDHLCRTRNCLNPEHLEPVTIGENVRRGESISMTQGKRTHCVNGHPFSSDNVRLSSYRQKDFTRGTYRKCKECARQIGQRYRERKRTAAQSAKLTPSRS